jgi:pyridoxal phosphate enzyme (YggS family)
MSEIQQNLAEIEGHIKAACQKTGRDPAGVRVLLATKSVTPERIREAARLGYKLCGENKAQELLEKIGPLSDTPLRWDFIGHLQSNKVKDVLEHCELIHSVDRLSLAQEISKRAHGKNKTARILVEVNTSGEVNKSGIEPAGALQLCGEISKLPAITVEGLMTLALNSPDEAAVRGCFKKLRELAGQISKVNLKNIEMRELSMGMSQDYAWAVEEGATIVRLGSAVFGRRN